MRHHVDARLERRIGGFAARLRRRAACADQLPRAPKATSVSQRRGAATRRVTRPDVLQWACQTA